MDVVIKQEKDDDGYDSHSRSWLDSPIDNRACEWCSAPDYMRNELPKFVNKPLDSWHSDLLLDLCYCFDCVQEYHRLQEELPDESKKLLHLLDIDRLSKTIINALDKPVEEGKELQEIATKLQVPLLEILRFPYFLHDKRLADLFKRGLIALNRCGCPLKLEELEEKLPGTYVLLVHPDPEVRGWAVRSVRGQGLINRDDYDVLKEVIGWMIQVVEFNLFEYSDLLELESRPFESMCLPSHLFIPLTIREYWLGLFVLLRQMDVETMQSCFMSFTGHLGFFNIIVRSMENQESIEDEGAFWPRLQCFVVLLERLGNRIWQISALLYKPHQLFRIITENSIFHNAIMQWKNNEFEVAGFSQEVFGDLRETRKLSSSSDTKYSSRFYKTALAWFQPFVQSLLDFESNGDCLSHVIEYLHHLAEDCLPESTYKLDVQSALLRIIHDLLARRMFELLAPTVSIWAVDVLDTVISEFGDKKMVEVTRKLLQHLLKACHRLGHKNALKFWEKFRLPGPKELSIEERQNILSILVQTFKAQHDPAFQVVHSSFGTKVQRVQVSCNAKAPSAQSSGQSTQTSTAQSFVSNKGPTSQSFGVTKAAIAHSCGSTKAATAQSFVSNKGPTSQSFGITKAAIAHSFGSTKAATAESFGGTKAPTVRSLGSTKPPSIQSRCQSTKALEAQALLIQPSGSAKTPIIQAIGSTEAQSVQTTGESAEVPVVQSSGSTRVRQVQSSGQSTKVQTAQAHGSIKSPTVHSKHGIKAERLKTKKETDAKPLRQSSIQIQGIRPLEEINISEGVSGFGRVAMENSGTAHLKKIEASAKPGPGTYVSSSEDEEEVYWSTKKRSEKPKPSFGKKVRVSQRSLRLKGSPIHAKVQLKDCMATVHKIKTEKGVQNVAIQSTARPKKTRRARKSTGTKKKYALPWNSGATSEDPIVLSDDEESATEPTEQKEPISTGNKEAGFLDDYFNYGGSENDDFSLNHHMDEYESPANAAKSYSTADLSLKKADSASENNTSDEELLHSVMEDQDADLLSGEPLANCNISSKLKAEKTDFDTGEGDVMDFDCASDDVALLDANGRLKSSPKTKPFPKIQGGSVDKSSVKTDLSDESDSSDDKPLSSFVQHKGLNSLHVKKQTDIAPRVKTEEIVLKPKNAAFNVAMGATAPHTSSREIDLPEIKSEVAVNASLFPEVNEIRGEVDYVMDGDREEVKFENANGAIEGDAEPTLQTVKTESTAQEKEETTSLSIISEQLVNDAIFDDETNFWEGDYGYSELVLNSQENALATVEEDLEDLYSTQPDDWKENATIFSTKDDRAAQDEANQTAKVKKHVTFASGLTSADSGASSSRSSVSHAAITQPSKALSEDDFLHEILSWKTERLCNIPSNIRAASLPRNYFADSVPSSFESIDQYYNVFKPLLFMEIWEEAVSSWRDKDVSRKSVAMNVLDGSTANNFWIIPCSGVINEHQQRKAFFPMESDLVLLTLATGDQADGSNGRSGPAYSGRAAFGFVEKAEVKQVQASRRVSMGSSGDDESNEVKFQLNLDIKTTFNFRPVRNCRIQVEFVTSLLTALRNWSGLMHLSKSILATDILRPRKTDYFCSNDYSHSAHVAKEYNESQEKVISTAANAVHKPFPIPRICLVQGPPGTGKSYTIVGLVKEILNRAQEMSAQTSKGPSSGSLANKVRILLCAPSNAAIDELIGRIKEARIQLDKRQDDKENRRHNRQDAVKAAFSTNCGDLCLVRVGRKSHIHQSVMEFSLDSMTKRVLEKASASTTEEELNKIKEKLKNIHNDEKKLEHEIWKLSSSPLHNQYELQRKETQKVNLINIKKNLEMKCRMEKAKRANKRREEARIRRDILNCADVICTTLSGAGSASLKQDLAGRHVCPFTCVIVDEACQSNELDLLIPLCFQASKLVLVGDPEQLPSTVLSVKAKEKLFGRSMFERLYRFFRHQKDMEKPVLMLEEQYRMHPEIAAFPSQHVYLNYLKSHRNPETVCSSLVNSALCCLSLEERPFPLAKHYAVFDVVRGQEISQERGALWNPVEVELIVNLCRDLTRILHVDSIGIITPYRKHKSEIQNRLKERNLSIGDATIEVHTVDGFQGREKDVIILSCVRAQTYRGSIGFLSDRQRMNVALTRARHALYVFGHMETLKGGSEDWKALVRDAEKRCCLFPVESPAEVRSVLSIGPSSNIQAPAKDPRVTTKDISASDSHGDSSKRNDRAVHQMDTARDVSKDERHQPITAEGKTRVSGISPTSSLERTNSKNNKALPSNDEVHGHAAESRKKVANSTHSGKQEQEKHGWKGALQGERYRKETRDVHRHRPTSDDRRHDDRHHRYRDRENKGKTHRPSHKDGDRNRATKESNQTHRERSTHHVPHRDHNRDPDRGRDRGRDRDRDRHRDRDRDREYRDYRNRGEGGACREKQMELNQSKMRPETKVRHASGTTTSSLDKNVASNAQEMPLNNTRQIGTKDYKLQNVLENNASHNQEYFLQLHRQERQSVKTRTSPVDTGWSTPDAEPDVRKTGKSPRVSQPTSPYFSSAAVWPSTSSATNPDTPLQSPFGASASPGETGWSPAESDWSSAEIEMSPVEARTSPVEADVTRTSNIEVPTRTQPTSRPFSTAPRPSTWKTTYSNVTVNRTHGATASSSSVSSGLSNSLEGRHPLDRRRGSSTLRGELPPDAQKVADKIRQRNPPVQAPPIISAPSNSGGWNLFGGSRKRTAHASVGDVSSVRQKATRVATSPPKRVAADLTRRNSLKKMQEDFRGRKSWSKDGRQ